MIPHEALAYEIARKIVEKYPTDTFDFDYLVQNIINSIINSKIN